MKLQPAIDHLAHYSAKVVGSAKYLLHVHVRMSTLETMEKRCMSKAPRRWFFECYRQERTAPNKRLRKLLSQYIPIVLSSEYRSSQRSHSTLYNRPSKKHVTVKQCTNCKTLLSRDISAACIILDIFEYQRKHMTLL